MELSGVILVWLIFMLMSSSVELVGLYTFILSLNWIEGLRVFNLPHFNCHIILADLFMKNSQLTETKASGIHSQFCFIEL